jgi:cellulose biosynthesis protein BcsQ
MINNNQLTPRLALISAKGGSGKTVISIAIAKILSEAKLQVLVIDCDVATHGATYFFESELQKTIKPILSFAQVLKGEDSSNYHPLQVDAGFDFVPSTLEPEVDTRRTEWQISKESISKVLKYVEAQEKYLFNMNSKFKTDLENNIISEDLNMIFKGNNRPLSNGTKISRVDNNKWMVRDGGKEYTIKESDNQLNIYQKKYYDCVILDCQAGYSKITEIVAQWADRRLIVLEADAITSRALRVLFLQLHEELNRLNTWQVFNKLSEEEANLYAKMSGGTLFPNLPGLPFDWTVRAAFALGEIPEILTKSSAFGLGVIRFTSVLFKEFSEALRNLEQKSVGDWFDKIMIDLKKLQREKKSLEIDKLNRNRRISRMRALLINGLVIVGATTIFLLSVLGTDFLLEGFVLPSIAIVIAFSAIIKALIDRTELSSKEEEDKAKIRIDEIDQEMVRYRALISTDSRLKEY